MSDHTQLRDIFKSMTSRFDKPLAQATLNNYVVKLNKLAVLMTGKKFDKDDLDWLAQPAKVIKKINDSELTGKKDYFSPVVRLLKSLNMKNDIIADYQKAMSDFKKEEDGQRNQNKRTDKEEKLWMSMPEILKRIDDYKLTDDDAMSLVYKLIVSLYFENELVPRNDLNVFKLMSSSKKPKDTNKNFNFITVDSKGVPKKMIMNRYKTDHTFKQQIFDITPKVSTLLKKYIAEFNRKNGDFLFVMSDGNTPFTKENMGHLVSKATEAVLGKPLRVDMIRRLIISDYYSGKAKSIEEDNNSARRFLHGIAVHKQYLRLPEGHESDTE